MQAILNRYLQPILALYDHKVPKCGITAANSCKIAYKMQTLKSYSKTTYTSNLNKICGALSAEKPSKILHEIVQDHGRMFFDMDTTNSRKHVPAVVRYLMEIDTDIKHMALYSGSGKCHLYTNLWTSVEDMRAIAKQIAALGVPIDLMPYSVNHSLRMVNQPKICNNEFDHSAVYKTEDVIFTIIANQVDTIVYNQNEYLEILRYPTDVRGGSASSLSAPLRKHVASLLAKHYGFTSNDVVFTNKEHCDDVQFTKQTAFGCFNCGKISRKQRHNLTAIQKNNLTCDIKCFHGATRTSIKMDGEPAAEQPPRVTNPFPHITINNRHIRDAALDLGEHNSIAIKSHMGTGKTEFITEYLADPANATKSVLMISFRQSFTREMCGRHGIKSYQDIKGGISKNHHPRVCVQVDSLHRIEHDRHSQGYEIVLIDEVESILTQMNSQQIGDQSAVLDVFLNLVKSAGQLVIMDAFLQSSTIYLLEHIRGGKILSYVNGYQPKAGLVNIYQYGPAYRESLLKQIQEKLDAGDNVAVACTELRCARAI
jgi:hypothetical protein